MSLVRPDTMRKKMLGNIAALDKKIAAVKAKMAVEEESLLKEKSFWEDSIKRLDELNPPLPFKPEIPPIGTEVKEPSEDEKNQEKMKLEEDAKPIEKTDNFAKKKGIGNLKRL